MAYGARLESVLSESSQGFESPILRSPDPSFHKGSRPEISPWRCSDRTSLPGYPVAAVLISIAVALLIGWALDAMLMKRIAPENR